MKKYRAVYKKNGKYIVYDVSEIVFTETGVKATDGKQTFLIDDLIVQLYLPYTTLDNKKIAEGDILIAPKKNGEKRPIIYYQIRRRGKTFGIYSLDGEPAKEKIKDKTFYAIGNIHDDVLKSALLDTQRFFSLRENRSSL